MSEPTGGVVLMSAVRAIGSWPFFKEGDLMSDADSLVLDSLEQQQTEVVFGLVGAVGTDLARLETFLDEGLQRFNYTPSVIRVTSLLDTFDVSQLGVPLASAPENERILTRIKAGNGLRRLSKRNDIFALYAAQQILVRRPEPVSSEEPDLRPHWRTAHVVHSLKHPEEVRTLRRLYGPGFFLIGVYSPESLRLRNLVDRYLMTEEQARQLIRQDENEKEGHGQHARDTFELSDVFIPMTGNEETPRTSSSVFSTSSSVLPGRHRPRRSTPCSWPSPRRCARGVWPGRWARSSPAPRVT
ncbi:hypothetical protein HPC49_10330 [Pyxidicoccus fallax]|uniref:Uncharacterized protein n=1 Tax=Pyxidicoccus fallax TaxID=394095 RepID=A0A848LIX7_9BACT|nr:hypothetical protein [Pyxidicoccus fallax]NMO17673.1 hypothetical protein [Pyxidicoccus fallax]NPC78639.1 hypothetical protein [Pyxidicoccus fallax]